MIWEISTDDFSSLEGENIMKKKLSVFLAFIMLMSTMCGICVSAEPAPDAPYYKVVAGENGISDGKNAGSETVLTSESWETFSKGTFPLTAIIGGTTAALGGQFVLEYDTETVELLTKASGEWAPVADGMVTSDVWYQNPSHTASITTVSGSYKEADAEKGYVYVLWFSREGLLDMTGTTGLGVELGSFVFRTKGNKTLDDFVSGTTFNVATIPAEVQTMLGSNSPYVANVNGTGGIKTYGITDTYGGTTVREEMSFVVSYPTGVPDTAKFVVTFYKDANRVEVLATIEKYVGETLLVADFPTPLAREGYTVVWDVTTNITAATVVTPVYTPVPVEPTIRPGTRPGGVLRDDDEFEIDEPTYDHALAPFRDVPEGHWAYPYVMNLVERGIFKGYGEGIFGPDINISRQEIAVALVRSMKLEPDVAAAANAHTGFVDDTEIAPWARGYVNIAVSEGLFTGYDDGTFLPNKTISRQELIAVLMRMAGGEVSIKEMSYTDADDIGLWAKPYVSTASELKIVGGYPDGSFKPLNDVTRAEAAKMVYNALEYRNFVH